MSKVRGFAASLAIVFSIFAVSCMGPNYKDPNAILASAVVPGANAAATPLASTSPWNGAGIFFFGAVLGLVCLVSSMYVFRAKPE